MNPLQAETSMGPAVFEKWKSVNGVFNPFLLNIHLLLGNYQRSINELLQMTEEPLRPDKVESTLLANRD